MVALLDQLGLSHHVRSVVGLGCSSLRHLFVLFLCRPENKVSNALLACRFCLLRLLLRLEQKKIEPISYLPIVVEGDDLPHPGQHYSRVFRPPVLLEGARDDHFPVI